MTLSFNQIKQAGSTEHIHFVISDTDIFGFFGDFKYMSLVNQKKWIANANYLI